MGNKCHKSQNNALQNREIHDKEETIEKKMENQPNLVLVSGHSNLKKSIISQEEVKIYSNYFFPQI